MTSQAAQNPATNTDPRQADQHDPSNHSRYFVPLPTAGDGDASVEGKRGIISIKYQVHNEIPKTYEERTTIKDYMKWKFFLNSPTQIRKCTTSFNKKNLKITVADDCIKISYPFTYSKACVEVVQSIVQYGKSCVGTVLTVEKLQVNRRYVGRLNETFGEEIAVCEVIWNKVFIAYVRSDRDRIIQCVKECVGDNILQDAVIHPILRHFEKEILQKLGSDCGPSDVNVEWTDSHLNCTIEGRTFHSVEDALRLFKEEEKRLVTRDVGFSIVTSGVLRKFNVKSLINEILSEAHPGCVAEQRYDTIVIFGFEVEKVEKAVKEIKRRIFGAEFLLTGSCFLSKEEAVLKYIQENFSKSIFATIDSRRNLVMIGLEDDVNKILKRLMEIHEGRVSLDSIRLLHVSTSEKQLKATSTSDTKNQEEQNSDSQARNAQFKSHVVSKPPQNQSAERGMTDVKKGQDVKSKQILCGSTNTAFKDVSLATFHAAETTLCTYKNPVQEREINTDQSQTRKRSLTIVDKFRVKEKDETFIEKFKKVLCDKYNVELDLEKENSLAYITGTEENVARSIAHLKSLKTEQIYITEDLVIDELNSSRGGTRLQKEADRNRTSARKKASTSWTLDQLYITMTAEVNKCDISCQTCKRLVVKTNNLENTKADVKFSLVEDTRPGGSRFADKQTHVEIRIDSHQTEFKENFVMAVTKADMNMTESAAFMLNPIANWTFVEIASSAADVFVRWLLKHSSPGVEKVVLCVSSQEEFSKTHDALKRRVMELLDSKIKVMSLIPSVCKGDLHCQEVDVIVNATSCSLNLSYGQVSAALLRAAGRQLQAECTRCYPSGIQHSDVAETNGYKLRCKKVYHVSVPKFDPSRDSECYQCLKTVIQKCLEKASHAGYTSIAFPVIGSGNLGYPRDMVTTLMFTIVETFKADVLETSIHSIKFVVYFKEESLFQDFINKQKQLARCVEPKIKKKSSMTITVVGKDEDIKKTMSYIEQIKKTCKSKHEDLDGASASAPARGGLGNHPGVNEYRLQNLTVIVCNGNILDTTAECLVSAANEHLSHRGGIAASIVQAAGQAVSDDCKAIIHERGLIEAGDLVETSPGKLKCKLLLHAVGPRWDDFKPVTRKSLRECQDTLRSTVLKALQLAADDHCKSIALPGSFGLPVEVCAEQYAYALLEFDQKTSPLKEVVFFDIKTEAFQTVDKTFLEMITGKRKSPWDCERYFTVCDTGRRSKATARDKPRTKTDQNSDLSASVMTRGSYRMFQFGTKFEVIVFFDDVFRLRPMDCIVCQVDVDGEPVCPTAKYLQANGSKAYEKERCNNVKAKTVGEAVLTQTGAGQFRYVLHTIVSRNWKDVGQMYGNIFTNICGDSRLQTICLPVLGGDGTDDLASVVRVIFDEWVQCCAANVTSRTSRLELNIVVPSDDVARVVEGVFEISVNESNKRNEVSPLPSLGFRDCSVEENKDTDAKVWPTCGEVFRTISGDQPDGTMQVKKSSSHLCGYEQYGAITVTYLFMNGIQGPEHPHPGTPYRGITRTAYLPDNEEGREICALLMVAFERRLVFTIRRSRTTGKEGVITWNDIHSLATQIRHTCRGSVMS